jgi:hypothetical protein
MISEPPATLLRRWAYLRALLRFSWAPTRSFVAAATQFSLSQREELGRLLNKSESVLAPLPDPLLASLGVHRWLSAEREESYSDWLAWILQELQEPASVLKLFGITDMDIVCQFAGAEVEVLREYPVNINQGYVRLDIVVLFVRDGTTEARLVVEVKKGSAEAADTLKQECYTRWHQGDTLGTKIKPSAVLIVTEAEHINYCGFEVVRWADLCVALRRMLPAIFTKLGIVKAAMFVAFVSAVEQNLLHLALQEAPFQDSMGYALIADHIRRALD